MTRLQYFLVVGVCLLAGIIGAFLPFFNIEGSALIMTGFGFAVLMLYYTIKDGVVSRENYEGTRQLTTTIIVISLLAMVINAFIFRRTFDWIMTGAYFLSVSWVTILMYAVTKVKPQTGKRNSKKKKKK